MKEDHTAVKKLFKEFQEAVENAHVRKGDLVKKILEELTVHT